MFAVRVHTGNQRTGRRSIGQCEDRRGDSDKRADRQQCGRANRRYIVKFEKTQAHAQVRNPAST